MHAKPRLQCSYSAPLNLSVEEVAKWRIISERVDRNLACTAAQDTSAVQSMEVHDRKWVSSRGVGRFVCNSTCVEQDTDWEIQPSRLGGHLAMQWQQLWRPHLSSLSLLHSHSAQLLLLIVLAGHRSLLHFSVLLFLANSHSEAL